MAMNPKPNLRPRSSMALLLAIAVLLPAAGCKNSSSRASEQLAKNSSDIQQLDSNLAFDNITLEQADEQGKLLWKVKATQATYSEDKQIAQVKLPDGDLYQDGKAIYRVKAQTGEVKQNGEKIVLRGQVVVTDLENKAVLTSEQMEWTPKTSVLIVRQNVKGTHPQVQMAANEARLYDKQDRMELRGKVVATTANPALQIKSEQLIWQMKDQKIVSATPIEISRFKNKRITDVATGNQAELNLKTKLVTLRQNAQIVMTDPPLQITSNILNWNPNQELLSTDQPVTVVQRQDKILITANQGQFDLQKRMAFLVGSVRATGQRNQSQLSSDRLRWNMASREVLSEGNVDYRQADPALRITGPRAVGKLENQTIVLNGGRVVTEIVPQ